MLGYDANVKTKETVQHQTALMWASAERHPDVVKTLISAHADLEAHTRKGFTALHFAAREGDQETVRMLLTAGVNVNIRTQPEEPEKGGGGPANASGKSISKGGPGGVVAA